MFFSELVERDRGLSMILMVWLFLPHHICKHTDLLGHLEPTDQPTAMLTALSDPVGASCPWCQLSGEVRLRPNLSDQTLIPRLVHTASPLPPQAPIIWQWLVIHPAPSPCLSLSLTCTYLSCQISLWSSSFLIQPCTHTLCHFLTLLLSFKSPCFFPPDC